MALIALRLMSGVYLCFHFYTRDQRCFLRLFNFFLYANSRRSSKIAENLPHTNRLFKEMAEIENEKDR